MDAMQKIMGMFAEGRQQKPKESLDEAFVSMMSGSDPEWFGKMDPGAKMAVKSIFLGGVASCLHRFIGGDSIENVKSELTMEALRMLADTLARKVGKDA